MQQFTPMTIRKKELDPHVGIKLRVTGDGTPGGTSVVDAETGARLWGVESIIIQCRCNEPPSAIIRVVNVQVDVVAVVDVVQGSETGK